MAINGNLVRLSASFDGRMPEDPIPGGFHPSLIRGMMGVWLRPKRSRSEKCELQACTGSLSIAPIIIVRIASRSAATNGLLMSAFPISSNGLSARLAANEVRISGPISIGISRAR
jgi:hypothetical protein